MLVECKTFRPALDRVLVEYDPKPTHTDGGLHIPATAGSPWERFEPATVRAVGPGRFHENGERQPMQVKVGDRVLVHPNAHTVAPIVVGGRLMFVVDEWGGVNDPEVDKPGDRAEVLAVLDSP